MKIRTPIEPLRVVPRRQTYIPHILAIALLWSLAMTWDYCDQNQTARAEAEDAHRQFVACLNGEWRGTATDGTRVGCMKAEALAPTQVSQHTKE